MACRQAKTWSRCIASHGLGLRLMTSRLVCSSCAIERGVQMARVVRGDWPHVDMDKGKRQVGGREVGGGGGRAGALTLQGLIRRAPRLSPVSAVCRAVYYTLSSSSVSRLVADSGGECAPCPLSRACPVRGVRREQRCGSGHRSSSLIVIPHRSRDVTADDPDNITVQLWTPAHVACGRPKPYFPTP